MRETIIEAAKYILILLALGFIAGYLNCNMYNII